MTGDSIDVAAFIAEGFMVIRDAIPAAVTSAVLERLLTRPPAENQSWLIDEWSVYDMPELVHAVTEPIRHALDVLVGPRRWHVAANWGFPRRLPGPIDPVWHIDGDWFTHHVNSGEQIMTPVVLWHDVGPDDAPTLLARGTHLQVARLLADHEPDGIPGDRIATTVHGAVAIDDVIAATGSGGDVYLCHPFLAHSFNPAGPRTARVVSNVCIHGREPIDYRQPKCPVDEAVARALL